MTIYNVSRMKSKKRNFKYSQRAPFYLYASREELYIGTKFVDLKKITNKINILLIPKGGHPSLPSTKMPLLMKKFGKKCPSFT